jgi:N-acetyl-gamma-glutamyl-phosphate reductase/acetylglutamate kinase
LQGFEEIQASILKASSVPKKLYRKGEPGSAHLFATPKKLHVGIVGARGYTGAELIQLISKHPEMELVLASSRSSAGKKVKDVVSGFDGELEFLNLSEKDIGTVNDVDLWVLALPNNTAAIYAAGIPSGKKIVDLSADFRFDTTGEWIYGLPERKGAREKIAKALKVSNPGCYATACQLALFPLIHEGLVEGTPNLFGVSGFSGAGTTPSPKNDISRLRDNLMGYSLVGHIHEREVSSQIGQQVFFAPHVASWFRGINLTASIPLKRQLSKKEVTDLYSEYYDGEPLVDVIEAVPEVRDIAGKHGASVGGFTVPKDGPPRVVVVSTLDNLRKGAATQCLQNMNIICGFDEFAGIKN